MGAGAGVGRIPFWLAPILLFCLFVLADMFLSGYKLLIEKECKGRHQAESDDVPSTMFFSRLWQSIVYNGFILGVLFLAALAALLTPIPFWLTLILLLCLYVLVDMFLFGYKFLREEKYKKRRQAESDDVPSTMKE